MSQYHSKSSKKQNNRNKELMFQSSDLVSYADEKWKRLKYPCLTTRATSRSDGHKGPNKQYIMRSKNKFATGCQIKTESFNAKMIATLKIYMQCYFSVTEHNQQALSPFIRNSLYTLFLPPSLTRSLTFTRRC